MSRKIEVFLFSPLSREMKEFIRKNKRTGKYCFLQLLYPLYCSITYNDTYTDFVHYIWGGRTNVWLQFLNMVHLLWYSRYAEMIFNYGYTSLYTQSFWKGWLIDTELITKLASLITELKNQWQLAAQKKWHIAGVHRKKLRRHNWVIKKIRLQKTN